MICRNFPWLLRDFGGFGRDGWRPLRTARNRSLADKTVQRTVQDRSGSTRCAIFTRAARGAARLEQAGGDGHLAIPGGTGLRPSRSCLMLVDAVRGWGCCLSSRLSRCLQILLPRILRLRWREAIVSLDRGVFVLGLGAGPALGASLTTTSAPLSGKRFPGRGWGSRQRAFPQPSPDRLAGSAGRWPRCSYGQSELAGHHFRTWFEGACARRRLRDPQQRRKSERGEFHRYLPGTGPRAAAGRRRVSVSGVGAGGGQRLTGSGPGAQSGPEVVAQFGGDESRCRKTGDILISFLEHGHSLSVQADRWVTNAGATDPSTGCATSGTLNPASGIRE